MPVYEKVCNPRPANFCFELLHPRPIRNHNRYHLCQLVVEPRLQLSMPSGTANHFQISRGKLAAGIYTYRLVMGEDGVSAFGKLVVQ
jgi:hypothetical protein